MSTDLPQFKDVVAAHERIRKYVHRTPVLTSSGINDIFSSSFFFKCENFQKVGAFKFRGATNAVLSLPEEDVKMGVGTHSSGNHAAALALAARMQGIQAHIVMPRTAPEIKKTAVRGYGGIITWCEPTLESRESTMQEVIDKTGVIFVPPYDHFNIICGQGTAAKELIEEAGELDIVMGPVGGGGLISGTAISTKGMLPSARVIAIEPAGADDAYRSFTSGKFVPSVNPQTIADGLLTSLGKLTFPLILDKVDEIITVSEDAIVAAMRMIWERMKIVVEPSGAVPFAAIIENKIDVTGKRVGLILTGGNTDLAKLPFK
ncbi:MAG: pyridoxal-phosphate dependent enzyme [Bacteroidales bacterium]|nr:pyridoxal-phosphate dependent enzyme [Bacteroidales bacterium]